MNLTPRKKTIVWAISILLTILIIIIRSADALKLSDILPPLFGPRAIGPATNTTRNISIRVDSILIGDEVGDEDGQGELSVHTLAVRRAGKSAKFSFPTEGNFVLISSGQEVTLEDYSLTVNQVSPDERIIIYFLAFDEDGPSSKIETPTNAIMEILLFSLEGLLEAEAELPRTFSDLTGFALGFFVNNLVDWWADPDVIAYYRIDLTPETYWFQDKAFDEASQIGNSRIRFSVLGSNAVPETEIVREVEVTRVIEVTRLVEVTRVTEALPGTLEGTRSPDPSTRTVLLETPTSPDKISSQSGCLRINFDVGGDVAQEGEYVVQETGGRILYSWYALAGWKDSDWKSNFTLSFPTVHVKVLYYSRNNSTPVEMIILNPAPGTPYGWLSRGQCHALEVAWPN